MPIIKNDATTSFALGQKLLNAEAAHKLKLIANKR
jgi:hypothetical protein